MGDGVVKYNLQLPLLAALFLTGLLLTACAGTPQSEHGTPPPNQPAPDWVTNLGTSAAEYPSSDFVIGFGMQNGDMESVIDVVKRSALSDLSGRLYTKLRSEFQEVITEESGGTLRSAVSSRIETKTEIEIPNPNFAMYSDGNIIYVLAYAERDRLASHYAERARTALNTLILAYKESLQVTEENKRLALLARTLPLFSVVYELQSFYRLILDFPSEGSFFKEMSIDGYESLESAAILENKILADLEELESSFVTTIDDASKRLGIMLGRQNVQGGSIEVLPFEYEYSSLSSEFGRVLARRLENLFPPRLLEGKGEIIIKGNYRQEKGGILLQCSARNEESGTLGRAFVRLPISALDPDLSLKPMNYDEAVLSYREFTENAIGDGGITIDMWTNKRSAVFEEEEALQLYLRVNQPAFLQLTYRLATGELLLLEKELYIGIDRVGRAVKLPYELEVLPPLGAEQIIVTAFSSQPPAPKTVIKTIDGEDFEIFSSIEEVTVQTKAVRKKQDSSNIGESISESIGEAILNITTIRKIP